MLVSTPVYLPVIDSSNAYFRININGWVYSIPFQASNLYRMLPQHSNEHNDGQWFKFMIGMIVSGPYQYIYL